MNASYKLGHGDFSPRLLSRQTATAQPAQEFVAYAYEGQPQPFNAGDHILIPTNTKQHPTLRFVAPVLRCGVAILGERTARKFVPVSPKRFVRLQETSGGGGKAVQVTVSGAAGELVLVDVWQVQTAVVKTVECRVGESGAAELTLPAGTCV